MFGLSSREALASRQGRWTRDIANAVNTLNVTKTQGQQILQVPKHGITMATTSSPRKSIITYMTDSLSESETDNNEVVSEQFLKVNNRLDDIINKLLIVEQYQIKLQLDVQKELEQLQIVTRMLTQVPSQMLSQVPSQILSQVPSQISTSITTCVPEISFVPYFNNEAYIGIDNSCKLCDNHLTFNIEIFGATKDKLILYPFGSVILNRELANTLIVEVTVQDGVFMTIVTGQKLATGIYVLTFTDDSYQPTKISYVGLI